MKHDKVEKSQTLYCRRGTSSQPRTCKLESKVDNVRLEIVSESFGLSNKPSEHQTDCTCCRSQVEEVADVSIAQVMFHRDQYTA